MKPQNKHSIILLICAMIPLVFGRQHIGYAHDVPGFHYHSDSTTRSVAENTSAGENIGSPVAASNLYGRYSYLLSGTDAASFDIVRTSGQLRTKVALDYETKSSYTVIVTVKQPVQLGGDEASINVTINVTNVNEAPVFPATTDTTLEIPENTAASQPIGAAITAMDPDLTDDNTDANPETPGADTLVYSLKEVDNHDSFAINSNTGQLLTKESLDHETKNSYSVTVEVSDSEFTAEISITITVTNIHTIFIDEDGNRINTATRSIPENSATNMNIGAPFTVQDPAGAIYAILSHVDYPQDVSAFKVVTMNDRAQLQTRNALNYETQNSYKFRLIAIIDDGVDDHQFTVTVNIEDVNEYAPVFADGNSATREVIENAPAGTAIGEPVAATDADGTAVLTYNLSGDDAASFNINDETGQLLTKYPLDYEFKNVYNFTITVTDNDPDDDADDAPDAHHTTTIPVTINVIDLVPAFIEDDPTTRSVAENTARGTNIGDPVSATEPDIGYTLTYSLNGTEDAPNDYKSFDIVSTNGQLKTKAALNYEVKSSYKVTVSVTDGNHPSDTITVTISVTDETEVTPSFREGNSTTRTIPENLPRGTNIGIPVEAINLGQYFQYERGGTDGFQFNIDRETGQLSTSESLNYESKSTYSLTVSIHEGGFFDVLNPGLLVYAETPADTISVTVNVENVNEAPMFSDAVAVRFFTPVNTEADQNIGAAITATDPDLTTDNTDANPETPDVDDTLTYTLSGDDAGSFDINSGTGQLTTNRGILVIKNNYNVTVTASDGTLSDTITVLITSTPVSIPVLTISEVPTAVQTGAFDVKVTFSEAVNGFMADDITLGGSVSATATVKSGSDGDSIYIVTITSANNAEGDITFSVRANAVLNTAEKGNNASDTYTVQIDTRHPTVTVSGISTTARTGTFSVTVTFSEPVTDFDDSGDIGIDNGTLIALTALMPEDDYNTKYIATFTPTNSEGVLLRVLSNAAKDAAGNGNFESSLQVVSVTLASPTVTITAPTTAQGVFDVRIDFTEHVTGFETTDISLTGTATATVTNLMGSGETYTATIAPTTGGTVIISLPANSVQDNESNGNSASSTQTVTVTLPGPVVTITGVPTTPQNSAFNVTIGFSEAVTGFISTDISLGTGVSATVTNLTGSAASYTATITPAANVEETIMLSVPAGVATNAPNMANIASSVHTIRLDTVSPTVEITGPTSLQTDAFEATVTFNEAVTGFTQTDISLTGSTATATVTGFTAVSGTKYTAEITPTTQGDVVISVPANAAQDTATNGNTASETLTVDLNDAPVFTDGDNTTRDVAVIASAGANIGEPVSATDPDIASSNDANPETADVDTLTYYLGGRDAMLFDINSETGQLLTTEQAYETGPQYMVIVTVSDGALIDTINVTIENISGSNAPVFTDGATTTRSVDENSAANTNIGTAVAAIGADTGDTLAYTLSGTDAASFEIVSTSGQLKTKAALDYETKSSYSVTVTASDGEHSASITVTITINNVNEAPTFPATTTTRSIDENTAANTNIGNPIAATDPDGTTDVNPDNPNVDALTYTLGGTDAASFEIVSTSGQLKTKAALDYETKSSYSITVTASDGEHSASITVTITINNVNEAPTFPATTTTRSINENTAANTNIGNPIAATDPDGTTDVNPDNPNVDALTYTLGGTDAASFEIVSTSGQLKTKAALDYETKSSYSVTVTASDGEHSASITVTITIGDINEAQPTISIDAASTVKDNPQNGAFEVTITFSEAVTGFTTSDIALTTTLTEGTGNATVTSLALVTGSDTDYTAEITPPTNAEGSVAIQVPAAAAQNAASQNNTVSNTLTVAIDTKSPTVTITAPTTAQSGAFDVTITFSETVTGFEASDISLGGTATATTTLTGSGTTYTANITPTTNGNVTIQVPAEAAQDAAGNMNAASQTHTVSVNLTALTVTITRVPTTPQNSAFTVSITFNEAVTGFTASDISLGSGVSATVTNLTGSGTTYTATITPAANVEEEIVISVPAGAAQNAANTDNAASAEHRVKLDTVNPTVTLTGPSGTQNGAFNITITFSETVTGFEADDISLSGTATATATLTGSGTTYTATITPTTSGNVTIQVPAEAAQDAANNANSESNTLTVTVILADPPIVEDGIDTIVIVRQDGVVKTDTVADPVTGQFELLISFDEPVTGFERSDLQVSQFSDDVSHLVTGWSGPHQHASGEYTDYIATVTPQTDSNLTFHLPAGVAHAADDGRPNREIKYLVRVVLDDGNINEPQPNRAPVFTEGDNTTRTVAEKTAANANIGSAVSATDQDNDTLTYSLGGTDAASFGIVSTTGQLKTSAALDYETKNAYAVTVSVSDGRGGTDSINVTINVTEVDENLPNNAPVFTEGDSTTRSIAEKTAANVNIGRAVSATDQDDDTLTYSLGGTDAASFSIVSTTGQLKTSAALDYETKNAYAVTVSVSDGRGGTDSINVTINVTEVDEAPPNRPPVFASTSITRSIGETTRAGVKIGDPVSATDPDSDTLTYSLEGTDAGSFSIDASSGQLKTKAPLDRDTKSKYTVTVKASDGQGGTDTITVTVNVLKPDRPDAITFVRQNGVVEHDQVVEPGTFELVMSFGQPVTGFERSDLGVGDSRTGATITGWQKSADSEKYTATIQANDEGLVTFTVPADSAQAADDGQGNVETKFLVVVRENGVLEINDAPVAKKGTSPPAETLLLPNYPNPSNPETWIPYQLSKRSNVEILIYNMRGTVVRRLELGHQRVGYYHGRGRAAHWDGRNALGERVAAGIYFYQLRTDTVTPLRKMVILK